jgi:hypothetical protein
MPPQPSPDDIQQASQRLQSEQLHSLTDLAHESGFSADTLRRWATRGVCDQAGKRHFLDTTLLAGEFYSSHEAILRYTTATGHPTAHPRSPRRTRQEIAAAISRVSQEELVGLWELASELGGGACHRSVERWIKCGKLNGAGERVYLDGLHRPGIGWMSSREAMVRFVRRSCSTTASKCA